MIDRELLELAAKAAGIKLRWHPDGTAYSGSRRKSYWGVWNPLTDDGDALRLAVKLKIAVTYPEDENYVRVWYGEIGTEPLHEDLKPDPYAATRRAIVRAAAEIGKNL